MGYILSFIFTYILPAVGKALGIDFLSSSMLGDPKSAWFRHSVVAAWQAIAMNTIIIFLDFRQFQRMCMRQVPLTELQAGQNSKA